MDLRRQYRQQEVRSRACGDTQAALFQASAVSSALRAIEPFELVIGSSAKHRGNVGSHHDGPKSHDLYPGPL
jgi:hypothetical protein